MRSFFLDFLFLYCILMEFNLQSAFTHVTSSYMKTIRININIYISRKAESPCAQGPGASSQGTGFVTQALCTSPALSTVPHNGPGDAPSRVFYPRMSSLPLILHISICYSPHENFTILTLIFILKITCPFTNKTKLISNDRNWRAYVDTLT